MLSKLKRFFIRTKAKDRSAITLESVIDSASEVYLRRDLKKERVKPFLSWFLGIDNPKFVARIPKDKYKSIFGNEAV